MFFKDQITTILKHYYLPKMDDRDQGLLIHSWSKALRGCPAWVLEQACDEWISMQNPHRYRRPVPGDIEEIIYAEMSVVRMAEKHMLPCGVGE